ncbi:NUDIX domain-containing protein [Alicyclobacillus suci]|uniref:NUDIX domain-containing protein n=1 Tax=Alicyclobacillus suci TaxID=2816080 RepID=UPI001CB76EB1|nr:NUDIX hydrolase [Alicyclobacillus suci]
MNIAANFCMSCGHALVTKLMDGVPRRACPVCEFVHWGNYSIGVGALVFREDRILLVRRAQEPGRGMWTNPGGYTEQTEPIHVTVEREVLEETGITAKVERIIALRDQPRQVHNVYVAFALRYMAGEPRADGVEVDDAGFFTASEMQGMNVAGLTKWLVDVAKSSAVSGSGLRLDFSEYVTSEQNWLFRTHSGRTQTGQGD